MRSFNGSLAEWSNAPVLKTGEGESPPRVRIPELPPPIIDIIYKILDVVACYLKGSIKRCLLGTSLSQRLD